jgi:glycosyltransferase involved in cell wall biosynthesis
MKILELTRSFYPSIGGMEKFVDDRLRIYKSLGYEYQVITTTHSEKKLATSTRLDNVEYLTSYTPYEIIPSLKRAMNLEYDVLSVNQVGYFYSDYAINIAFSEGKKIILTPHFYFHTDRYKYIKDRHFKWVLPRVFDKVSKVICFTEYEKQYWLDKFSLLKKKIEIIPHYFQPSVIKSNNSSSEYGDYLLFLGRGDKNKRIDLLIPAFNEIETDFELVLTIDKDELSSSLSEIVDKNKRIHLLGRVTEEKKQTLLAYCSALILPTDYEAFGIVNFEASYYKKPLLLSELEIFNNTLDNNGVIYFKNNEKDIISQIRKFILISNGVKNEMGLKNYSNLNNYKFVEVCKRYNHLFNELF